MSWTLCRICALAAVLILIGLSGGCTTLTVLPGLSRADKDAPEVQIEPGQPVVNVKLQREGAEPRRVRLPLDRGMLIEDALKTVGAIREFPHMDIVIVRTLPDGKQMKLDIRYDSANDQVEPAFNYALLPNDLVLIREVSVTPLDSLMDAIGGSLTKRYRRS